MTTEQTPRGRNGGFVAGVTKPYPSLVPVDNKTSPPLRVTSDDLEEFDRRMGLPGLGMRYVAAGHFVLVDEGCRA